MARAFFTAAYATMNSLNFMCILNACVCVTNDSVIYYCKIGCWQRLDASDINAVHSAKYSLSLTKYMPILRIMGQLAKIIIIKYRLL